MANKAVAHSVNREEETIDLLELTKVVLRRIWIILICLVIGFTGGYAYTHLAIPSTYSASSMIYVYTKTTSVTSLADLQIGTVLTVDFQIIAQTREVVDAVKADLAIEDSYEDICKKIKVDNPDGSRILKITATDTDPQKAANLANSMANQLRIRIADVMDTDPPSIVSRAVVQNRPVGPSATRNGLICGMALAAFAVAVIVIRYLLDDTIKSEADVEKYLGKNVIATMPLVPGLSKK